MIVLGCGGVGKSSLVSRYVNNHFPQKYIPTIEDSYRKMIDMEGKAVNLELYDVAGQEVAGQLSSSPENLSITDPILKSHIKICNAFLIVFDVTSELSFNSCTGIVYLVRSYVQFIPEIATMPILIVANKCDVPPDERRVDIVRIQKMCTGLGLGKHVECSAKTGERVSQAFEELIRLYWHYHKNAPQSKPSPRRRTSIVSNRKTTTTTTSRNSIAGGSCLPAVPSTTTATAAAPQKKKKSGGSDLTRSTSETFTREEKDGMSRVNNNNAGGGGSSGRGEKMEWQDVLLNDRRDCTTPQPTAAAAVAPPPSSSSSKRSSSSGSRVSNSSSSSSSTSTSNGCTIQ